MGRVSWREREGRWEVRERGKNRRVRRGGYCG